MRREFLRVLREKKLPLDVNYDIDGRELLSKKRKPEKKEQPESAVQEKEKHVEKEVVHSPVDDKSKKNKKKKDEKVEVNPEVPSEASL